MATEKHLATPVNGAGLVRDRLLNAMQVGRLRPGDRVLSVRRLADMTGVNHKTVHRAYTALAREGILEVRPGSGTFISERRFAARGLPAAPRLLATLERVRGEAERLGLSPHLLSRFLEICLADGLRGLRVGLVECNREQIAMIGRDLHRSLGVEVRPISLNALQRNPEKTVAGIDGVVTTDCHYSQVKQLVEPYGAATHTVTLDTGFPRYMSSLARRSEIVMVVSDHRFGPVFTKLLGQLLITDELLGRIRFVQERRALTGLRRSAPGTRVYLSPLVRPSLRQALPGHVLPVNACWHVEPSALEAVRAGLALDRALRIEP